MTSSRKLLYNCWTPIYTRMLSFTKTFLLVLVERSSKIFKCLCNRKLISEKELYYFTCSSTKATNLGVLYLLPKIHKRLSSVPGIPVISNCGTPTGKVSEYLNHILERVMEESWSYVKNFGDFPKKAKHLGKITYRAILVTTDVVGLFPNIIRKTGLETLRRRLNERETSKTPTEDIVQMAEIFL